VAIVVAIIVFPTGPEVQADALAGSVDAELHQLSLFEREPFGCAHELFSTSHWICGASDLEYRVEVDDDLCWTAEIDETSSSPGPKDDVSGSGCI
jgi:hypothetical protein